MSDKGAFISGSTILIGGGATSSGFNKKMMALLMGPILISWRKITNFLEVVDKKDYPDFCRVEISFLCSH